MKSGRNGREEEKDQQKTKGREGKEELRRGDGARKGKGKRE